MTLRTGGTYLKKSLGANHLPPAVTARAGLFLVTGTTTGAFTGPAGITSGQFNLFAGAVHCLHKRDA